MTDTTTTATATRWGVVTGDWLLNADDDRYAEGYFARVDKPGPWGGPLPRVTRSVAEAIVARQSGIVEADAEAQRLAWDGDVIVATYDASVGMDPERIEPDADTLYDVSFGWVWQTADADACDTVHRPDPIDALTLILNAEEQICEDNATMGWDEYEDLNRITAAILGEAFCEGLAHRMTSGHASPQDMGDVVRAGRGAVADLLNVVRTEDEPRAAEDIARARAGLGRAGA